MIQIKRNNKVFFTLEDFGEGSKLSYQLMDHHYIILKFTTATPIYFEIGDSVEIPDFGYFELTSSYFPKHNDSDGYDYEMQMDAYYMSWKNKICKYRPQHGANETSFNLTTTVGVHMNVILGNLKALGLTYNGKEFSVDYTTYNNKAFDVQKRFLIEYGSISILDALNAICSEDALNCEWWIDGSIIYLGYCEMEGQTTFEQDVNVLSMSYSESKSTYITRLYAFGSDRNIPKGYFTGADADVTTDGVATDYLMLPNKEVDSDGFYAKDGYLENVNVVKNDKQAIEGVVMFEEEYPKVESVVSSIKTYDSTVDNEDGTKTTQTFWQVTSTDSFTNSFKESWIKSNLTLGIKFTSGALMGMEFDVSFKVIDKVNYFEIVANDTYGRTLPDGVMCPKVGDKYFLFNWDATKITDTDLIPTAQLSLFDRAKQYYQKTMISNSNFTCTMDGDKFYNDGIYDYHPLGEQVKLINDMFAQVDADGKHYRNSRIIGMEIPLDIPYDHPQYTVGEKAATSRLGKLEDKVDSIKVNGMQIGGTGSGNGGGVYVIGMNDTTPASDSNVYSARRSRMEFVSRLLDNTAKGTITWEKVQKFFSGLHVGNSNNENGGSWTPDAEGRSHLITDYLEVRMKAIFEELVINKTSTIGGNEIISPAGGVVAHKVEEVTVTYNNVSQKAYRCYFLAEQEGDAVDNDFAVNDQVRSESFNVRKGTYHKAGNHFYWRLVIGRDEDPVELEGKKYHYIDLSDTDCATASDVPAKGDVLNQCGNRTDVERQNCLIFSAVDTYSPSISLYHGINSYSFANREYVEYGVNKQNNKAFFNVYGDMYVGDRPTKENGYEGSSYIRYDSSTKQVSVKGKISAKSTVDGKELSQYIKENTDDTVANEAKKAAEDAQKAAQTAQTNITNLGNTVIGNKKDFDNYVTNGYLEPSEIAAMAQDSKRLEDDFAAAQKSYNEVKEAEVLANTNELIDLKTAFDTLTTAKTELVTYLSDISARYNKADTNGKATIVSAVGTKFTNFQSAYSAFYDKLGFANAYITSKIYGDLGVVIGDVATYQYLKKVLADGVDTEINGGLILTSLIALRDPETKRVESGINGVIDKTAKGNGIATWWGGYMNDGEVVGFDKKEDYSKQAATSLVRFDGSGYLANGAIWWGTDGRVHADPTSFIISEKNLGAYLTFFEPTWKEGSAGTSVADLVSLKPNAPFSKLGVSGDATFEGAITFHGIKISYDSTNKAIKIDGNLYATGGITAYGAGASTTGGDGGLNGSVKSYSSALKLTSESLSEIASAYSIKALDSRISSLEGGSAMDVSVSGSGNAVTAISKSGTTIIVTKGTTFLTSHQSLASYLTRTDAASLYQPKGNYLTAHQSLDGYVNAITTSGSGNAITSVTKSGKTVTFTKGATFLTSHQSLSAYLKSADAANTYLKLSGGAMTGNIRYKGSKSTYDMITFVDNNADTYGNGICIGGGGLTIIGGGESANAVLSQYTSGGDEYMIVANDAAIDFFSNLQNGWNSRKAGSFDTSGYWNGAGFKKDNSSDSYVLLGGGGHKAISSLSVNYASSAGSASSVAWSNVSGRPTKVSQFTNDNGYITSSGSCAYATSAGNADKVDGIHANGLLTALSNSDKGISITVGGTTKSVSNISVNYASSAGNADTVDGYHVNGSNVAPYGHIPSIENDGVMEVGKYIDFHNDNSGKHDFSTRLQTTDNYGNSVYLPSHNGTLALISDNVASATKLATARSIWGQSFDGTGNVNGTIYINNSDSSNGAIRLNSDISSNARISAINDQVIFNTGNAIRFGETAWDWNQWAGLKYTHSNKTIYLGIADGSVFSANNAQSNGTLRLAGITTITPDSGARIGGSGGDLYLGNANNSNWVKVQDICSHNGSNYWYIYQSGNAHFKNIDSGDATINGTATINGNLLVSGLIDNKGIIPASSGFNDKGTSCYVSADALCSGITAITDSIQVNQVTVQYSNDSGNSWTNYSMGNDAKFNLYASNAGLTQVYLGYNVITGNNDAEKLAQVKKNELIVSFYISNSCYAQPYFASVDISNGIDTICTVEILNNSGAVVETYTKHMAGWSQVNYISLLHNGNAGYGVGNNDRRYIKFKFKHDQKTTALRNTVINKIRIFSFTKYSFPTDRFMGHTGHIYNFDYNMNTYFPNSILAKGGVTAYQSSDIRLKKDLRKLDYFGIIKAMGGTFGFAWKKDNTRSIGWIAQHVLCNPHLKDIVETDEKGYYKINYWSPKLIATAFGAIEQVGDEVSRLKARVVFLESEVQRLSGDKDGNNKKRLDNKNINSLN